MRNYFIIKILERRNFFIFQTTTAYQGRVEEYYKSLRVWRVVHTPFIPLSILSVKSARSAEILKTQIPPTATPFLDKCTSPSQRPLSGSQFSHWQFFKISALLFSTFLFRILH